MLTQWVTLPCHSSRGLRAHVTVDKEVCIDFHVHLVSFRFSSLPVLHVSRQIGNSEFPLGGAQCAVWTWCPVMDWCSIQGVSLTHAQHSRVSLPILRYPSLKDSVYKATWHLFRSFGITGIKLQYINIHKGLFQQVSAVIKVDFINLAWSKIDLCWHKVVLEHFLG